MMRRLPTIPRAVLLGMGLTQLLATGHVYLSNRHLHESLVLIAQAGYLPLPNEYIMGTFLDMGPAFLGGLFFTLTVGAGLSLLAGTLGWAWTCMLKKNRGAMFLLATLWISLVVLLNITGFSAVVTSYFLLVPALVFHISSRWTPSLRSGHSGQTWLNQMAPVLAIILLTLVWASLADRLLFMNIRDYLLLSNPVGRAVDRFYYRYTLYPAQAFKPLDQKTLKTCLIDGVEDENRKKRIVTALEAYDYLPVSGRDPIDVKLVAKNSELAVKDGQRTVVETTVADFLSDPQRPLHRFSAAIDTYGPFRRATFLCLLVGFPVLLYIVVFALSHWAVSYLVAAPERWNLYAAVTCLVIGLGLLAAVHTGRLEPVSLEELPTALESNSWRQRTEGLRLIVQKRLEIGHYPAYKQGLTSPHVPERYWLTKAIGLSRDPDTRPDLLTLLEDPHPNVVSMAFQALGHRGDSRWIPEILQRIKTSRHWYNQWYAYRALKSLGWRQHRATGPTPSP